MTYLLDTNILSELAKPRIDPGVEQWMRSVPERDLAISVVALGELELGIALLEAGEKKAALQAWLTAALVPRFAGRILAIDPATAALWGRLTAARRRQGRPIGVQDAYLAATALAHGLTLVTRNERDFAATGVPVVNPFAP